ncbi:hypothetical protein PR003_g8408 [Phytophthora rubi]|uniref:Uncharacterized protein n=1 Tax=Phytophthora rubi TaxID=129364 RepID=A0A6A4FB90_9STRA|nr:hypothetical protein PR003_g8408 [Phytophthora rubi]
MGEQGGIPKGPLHIVRLYLTLGDYTQAAKTAVIIASQEQELGNYKLACEVPVRELLAQAHGRRLAAHGQRRLGHERVAVLHHDCVYVAPGRQARGICKVMEDFEVKMKSVIFVWLTSKVRNGKNTTI